jgi:outer membrane receptor protein involved in Fe transport
VFGFEIAAFHIDWQDIQLLATDGVFNFNANGGGAKSDGIEFSATAAPARGLDLSLNGAYTNARLTTDTLIGGLDGDKLPFTPEFTVSMNGDYSFAVGAGAEAHVGGSFRFLSEQSASFDADYRAAHGEQRELDPYGVVDFGAGVDFGQFDIELYVKNLFDSSGRTSTTGTDVFGGFPLYPAGAIGMGVIRPRTVGLSASAEF